VFFDSTDPVSVEQRMSSYTLRLGCRKPPPTLRRWRNDCSATNKVVAQASPTQVCAF